MNKLVTGLVLIVLGITIGWLVRPRPPSPRPPLPAKTDTVYVDRPGPTQIELDTLWMPPETVRVNTVFTRIEYDTVRVLCSEVRPRRNIVSAVFGSTYGDSSFVLSELMKYERDSLTFQLVSETIYTNGMPARISSDLDGAVIDWRPFPEPKNSSLSIFDKILWALVGYGGGKVIEAAIP